MRKLCVVSQDFYTIFSFTISEFEGRENAKAWPSLAIPSLQ